MRKLLQKHILTTWTSVRLRRAILLLLGGIFFLSAINLSIRLRAQHFSSFEQIVNTFQNDPGLVSKAISRAFVSTQLTYTLNGKDLWDTFEADGVHIVPVHYYSPLPDFRELSDAVLERKLPMPGVDLNQKRQEEWRKTLTQFSLEFRKTVSKPVSEAEKEKLEQEFKYYLGGPFAITPADALQYYTAIRFFKPKRIVEVGAGGTSRIALQAIQDLQKEGIHTKYHVVEPYINQPHTKGLLQAGRKFDFSVIEKKIQDVDLEVFLNLGSGDILLIDSSHRVFPGSDVQTLYLNVLPRLAPGVVVLIHDILLPYEYGVGWYKQTRFLANEAYVLQALLVENPKFEIISFPMEIQKEKPDLWKLAVGEDAGPTGFAVIQRK